MGVRQFAPKPMKLSVLTAALQELTPRARARSPIRTAPSRSGCSSRASWAAPTSSCRRRCIPRRVRRAGRSDARSGGQHARPAQALRQGPRASRVLAAMKRDRRRALRPRLLRQHAARRRRRSAAKKHDFMLRVFDAAVLLGVDAVCGFVGRNQKLEMDQNLVIFEEVFIPLLKDAKARGLDVPRRAMPDARLDRDATTGTTTSPTRPGPGSRCTASARSTAWAISSASTTIRRTRS